MTKNYQPIHQGDYAECQQCAALVANNTVSRARHTEWHAELSEQYVRLSSLALAAVR